MYSHHNIILDGASTPTENIDLSDDDSILSFDSELGNDSNLSYSAEKITKPETKLLEELRTWITNNKIGNTAVNDLLIILSRHGHQNLSSLCSSTNTLKREASSPIMNSNSKMLKIPSTSNNENKNDISARLDTVEQKIDSHQIATQQVLVNQATMQQILNLILEKLPGGEQNLTEISDSDMYYTDLLPIKSIDMLEEYEAKLRNSPEFKNKMIRLLSQFGGPDAKKTSRNIVRAMISDEVLINFSWTGTNTKKVFSWFREINLTIIATMRKKFHNYTEYDNATFFKEYLKHTSTRLCRNDPKKQVEFKKFN